MTWMHCLNCGWQGENNAGQGEKIAGAVLLIGGLAAAILVKPLWIGLVALGIGVVLLLVSAGAAATLACPHCQSTDIKRYKPSLAERPPGGSPPHPGG